jgi:hypothetical protein
LDVTTTKLVTAKANKQGKMLGSNSSTKSSGLPPLRFAMSDNG